MGTNFYMFSSDKEKKVLFGEKASLTDIPDFGYEIHIAKTSAGWLPCFEAHENIRSVADLKLLYDKGGIQIFDEYGTEYTWEGFVKRVVNFGNDFNWRSNRNNEYETYYDHHEFTSVDGYRFSTHEFC